MRYAVNISTRDSERWTLSDPFGNSPGRLQSFLGDLPAMLNQNFKYSRLRVVVLR